ncbi:hypothetical protein [Pseudomonas sp. WHRI 8519]
MSTPIPHSNEAALRPRVDACLLTDEEMAQGPRGWMKLPNPFTRGT